MSKAIRKGIHSDSSMEWILCFSCSSIKSLGLRFQSSAQQKCDLHAHCKGVSCLEALCPDHACVHETLWDCRKQTMLDNQIGKKGQSPQRPAFLFWCLHCVFYFQPVALSAVFFPPVFSLEPLWQKAHMQHNSQAHVLTLSSCLPWDWGDKSLLPFMKHCFFRPIPLGLHKSSKYYWNQTWQHSSHRSCVLICMWWRLWIVLKESHHRCW